MKVGDVFFTVTDRFAKILHEFTFGDGYKFIGAVWVNGQWIAIRFNDAGVASIEPNLNNRGVDLAQWINTFKFEFKFNTVEKSWEGVGIHISNAALNVRIVQYDSPEKVIVELKKAAEEKVLEYLKPFGYPLKNEDAAA